MNEIIPMRLQSLIIEVRNQKVILDFNLAHLYEVENRALKQQVRRNLKRFPSDFMFELTDDEITELVKSNVIPNKGVLGGARPLAFSEQGVAMLSSVLRSDKAIDVNIAIMRTFVFVRNMVENNKDLKTRIDEMEKLYDEKFDVVFKAIKVLIEQKNEPRTRIGYKK